MLELLILGSLLVCASAGTESDVEDVDLVDYLHQQQGRNNSSGVMRACHWVLDERQEASGWGSFTPRAVVALALASPYCSLPRWDLITKQLNVHLSLQLGSGVQVDESSKLSRLALAINALLATCQDTRHFRGTDLVKALRSETDAAVRKHGDGFRLPSVFVSLCLVGEATHSDLNRVARMYQESRNNTDLQAIQLLAMSCMTRRQKDMESVRPLVASYLREFAARFQNSLRNGNMDIYTKALAMQALLSMDDDSVDISNLLADQESDGSFERSLLATYHAIPALMGTSLLALGNKTCQQTGRLVESSPPAQSSPKVVQLSAWIGEGLERDTHSVTVAIGQNDTLLDVLRAARKRNPIFRFSYDETSSGARVYSLAGIPNDPEREISWQLYAQNERHKHLKQMNTGVDKVHPFPDDHIVFWFKRNSL